MVTELSDKAGLQALANYIAIRLANALEVIQNNLEKVKEDLNLFIVSEVVIEVKGIPYMSRKSKMSLTPIQYLVLLT